MACSLACWSKLVGQEAQVPLPKRPRCVAFLLKHLRQKVVGEVDPASNAGGWVQVHVRLLPNVPGARVRACVRARRLGVTCSSIKWDPTHIHVSEWQRSRGVGKEKAWAETCPQNMFHSEAFFMHTNKTRLKHVCGKDLD